MRLTLFVFMFLFCVMSFAQTAPVSSPVASPVPTISAPAPAASSGLSGIVAFLKGNWAAISLALYSIIDVIIAVSPNLAANGLVHALLLFFGKQSGQTPPAASAS